jgi:hypothetical protein
MKCFYNLKRYLKDTFPTEKFYLNFKYNTFPDNAVENRCITITEGSGTEGAWFKKKDEICNILVRDNDQVLSRQLAYLIYNKLHGRFGLILPAENVDGEYFPSMQIAQISSQNVPQCLGEDDNGRTEYTFAIKLIYV